MEEGGDQKPQLLEAVHKVKEGKWLEWIVTGKWNEEPVNLEKHLKRGGLGEAEEEKCKSRTTYEGVRQYGPQSCTLFIEKQEASATRTILS
jgi:hypothetical protein